MGELEENVALVTGAGGGIGAGIVAVLAREGATVVVTDLDEGAAAATAARIERAGGTALALAHDVADGASCRRVVAATLERFGRIDTLVNNAGIAFARSFRELDERDWDRTMDVNLKGVYHMIRATIEGMVERGSGAIVNISSLAGKEAHPGGIHYAVTKFGVIALTQGLAKELAQLGVRVNAVCPGIVRTALWEGVLDQRAEREGISREQAWAEAIAPIPMGVPQEPEDIGEVVAFLASERARYVTGEAWNVAGGQEMR